MHNLFSDIPANLTEELTDELIEVLATSPKVRIERIVSTGQASPPGFWYDQAEREWVVVLKGEAKLLMEGNATPVHLQPGDYLSIAAHQRHRVEWTSPTEPTVWLAIFFKD